jgi:tRNA threonylcarbamoyladenosine modification (KEOPS) complex Cgi121 subunit
VALEHSFYKWNSKLGLLNKTKKVASEMSGRELTQQVMEAQAMMGRTEPPV